MGAMDAEMGRDVAVLNPELLQIAEVSPSAMKEKPHIVENLYAQWLSLPDTIKLVFFSFVLNFIFSDFLNCCLGCLISFVIQNFNGNFCTALTNFAKNDELIVLDCAETGTY